MAVPVLQPWKPQDAITGTNPAAPTFARWLRDAQVAVNGLIVSPLSGIVEVIDVVTDGITDNLSRFVAALDLLADAGGGWLWVPPGRIYLSGLFDLTSVNVTVRMIGAGMGVTTIISGATTTAAILVGDGSTRYNTVSDLSIYQVDQVLPAVQRSGNYGIRTMTGINNVELERVEVRFFGDNAFQIEGATGYGVVRDCYAYSCAGYTVNLKNLGAGVFPQDVTIIGGSQQNCWGGLHSDGCQSCTFQDTDIELGADGHFPAVHMEGPCYGNSFINLTASTRTGSACVPAGVVAFVDGPQSNVWHGGISYTDFDGVDNLLVTGAGTIRNSFVGGAFTNSGNAGSGYYANVADSATQNRFLDPLLSAGSFGAGKDRVHQAGGVANTSIAIGVDMDNATAGTATGGAATLPANPVGFVVSLLPDGTSVRVPYYSA